MCILYYINRNDRGKGPKKPREQMTKGFCSVVLTASKDEEEAEGLAAAMPLTLV